MTFSVGPNLVEYTTLSDSYVSQSSLLHVLPLEILRFRGGIGL